MTSAEEHDQTKKAPSPRFVEELADENDYWMSLTDAARITRTSEPMVRRWVATGRLPIKKEPVGINQRTRLVRVSDVGRIRPIIDPTAAITDDIHKLDLPSIPRQQTQIMHDHQRFLELVEEMRQGIENHIHQTRTALEQGARELHEQMRKWDRAFVSHQIEWQQALHLQQQHHEALVVLVDQQMREIKLHTSELKEQERQQQWTLNQLERVQGVMQEVQRHLERLDQNFLQQADQMHRELTTHLKQQEEHVQDALARVEETLAHYHLMQKQIQHDVVNTQQDFSVLRETLMARIEQQGGEMRRAFEQQQSELVDETAAQNERLEGIEQKLEAVMMQNQADRKTWIESQDHAAAQDEQIQILTKMFHDERTARQSLSELFTLQQEQVQILRRELECLKTQKAVTEE